MRTILALGVAFAAMAMSAAAETDHTRVVIRHGGPHANMDGDHDGWLSRAEASAAADAMFAELDGNADGQLSNDDHPHMDEEFDLRLDGADDDDDENCTRTEASAGAGERRVTVICHGPSEGAEREHRGERVQRDHDATETEAHGERRIERHVTVIHGAHADAPTPPHPPMAMMFMHSEEADLNNDGAMSREEFRAQHLRFFDAGDVNGDGRVRLPAQHAQAPAPPTPPTPPAPPRRR